MVTCSKICDCLVVSSKSSDWLVSISNWLTLIFAFHSSYVDLVWTAG